MKKLRTILILITILGSYLIFEMNFKNVSMQRFENNFNSEEFSDYSSQYTNLSNLESIDKEEYFYYLTSLAEKYSVFFYMNTSDFVDGSICKRMYMYLQDTNIYTKNSSFVDYKELDFTNYNEEGFYTSRMHDKKASGHIYYLNKDDEHINNVEVYSFGYAVRKLKKLDNNYIFYAKQSVNLKKFISELSNNPYKISISAIDVEVKDSDAFYMKDRDSYRQQYLFILMVLFVVSFLVYISKHEQEIVVRKMQGISDLKIFTQLFKSLIIAIIGVNVFTMSMLCYINIEYWNWVSYEFLGVLIPYVILITLILICLSLLMMWYFHVINLSLSLKKQNKKKYLLNMDWCIKIVVLFFVANSLYPLGEDLMMSGKSTRVYHQAIQEYGSMTYIEGYKWGYNSYFNKVKDQDKIVNILLKYGAIYYKHDTFVPGDDSECSTEKNYYVEVNNNYIKKYPIYDKKNRKVDLDGKETVFFVPDKMLSNERFPTNVELLRGWEPEAKKVEILHTKGDILYFAGSNVEFQFKDKAIKVIQDDSLHSFMPQRTFLDLDKKELKAMKKELNDLFAEKNYLNIYNYGEYMDVWYQQSLSFFLNNLFQFISLVLIIGMLMYEYIYLYLDINKKEIAIRNTLGFKYFDQYKSLYTMQLLSYIFLLSVFIVRGEVTGQLITTLLCLFIIESSLTYIITYLFEKKNVTLILKGDED